MTRVLAKVDVVVEDDYRDDMRHAAQEALYEVEDDWSKITLQQLNDALIERGLDTLSDRLIEVAGAVGLLD